MLSRDHRATTNDLARIGRGRVIRTKHLLFSYTAAPVGTATKIGCSVAKKVAKLAVDRNRLKRQCREALVSLISSPIVPIIAIARIVDATATSKDFHDEVEEIVRSLPK